MNIYFICTGNTCRSPMAEAILRSKDIKHVAVRSAGIHAGEGWPISQNAKELIEEAAMPYTPASRVVSSEDLEWADLVLTMTEAHEAALQSSYPEMAHKIFTLKGYVLSSSTGNVHDPYGGDIATYRHTFDELTRLMDVLERKLMEGQA